MVRRQRDKHRQPIEQDIETERYYKESETRRQTIGRQMVRRQRQRHADNRARDRDKEIL